MIEVEIRGLLDEDRFLEVLEELKTKGKDLGRDDKEVSFFVFANQTLKVANDVSKGQARVALKGGNLGDGAAKIEKELYIAPDQVGAATDLIASLGDHKLFYSKQFRRNIEWEGALFAFKYSQRWGYHFEIEKLVTDSEQSAEATAQLLELATLLDLPILSQEEEVILVKKFETGYERGTYAEIDFKVDF